MLKVPMFFCWCPIAGQTMSRHRSNCGQGSAVKNIVCRAAYLSDCGLADQRPLRKPLDIRRESLVRKNSDIDSFSALKKVKNKKKPNLSASLFAHFIEMS